MHCENNVTYISGWETKKKCLTFDEYKEKEKYLEHVGKMYESMNEWQGNVNEDYIF